MPGPMSRRESHRDWDSHVFDDMDSMLKKSKTSNDLDAMLTRREEDDIENARSMKQSY